MIFKIQPALVNKVVGYIASDSMTEGYQYDKPISIYNINVRGKLEFTPDIDAVKILKRAKLMDILECVPLPRSGILISDKLLKIFLGFTIPIHTQIFDAYIDYQKQRLQYHYFYIYQSNEHKHINWKKSSFRIREFADFVGDEFKLDITDIRQKWANGKTIESFGPTKLVFNNDQIKSDVIRLDFSYNGYFVNEDLKKEIEKEKCQGIDFIPIDQLGFKVEFI